MIKFKRIDIRNFVCFDDIAIEPSTDTKKPLTVVRAENGSGKTTLLRAIRWGMYGEKGLPLDFPLHPAWWTPDDIGITTLVSIEFETDSSDRLHKASSVRDTVYLFRRSVTTIGKRTDNKDVLDSRRINEQTQLMVQEIDGSWKPLPTGVDSVINQLLPWELRDFFVMDADKVADFVGGSYDDKELQKKDVIAKTTNAINGLLGIDIFKMAQDRVDKIGRNFGKEATVAVGDSNLDDLQSELDQLRSEKKEFEKEITKKSDKRKDLVDRLQKCNINLESELKGIGAAEELPVRLEKNNKLLKREYNRHKMIVNQLARQVESIEFLATLSHTYISDSYNTLKPLYDSGYIPVKHLYYVRSLLKSGICVCGQDISQNNKHRDRVLEQIKKSSKGEERANYLSQIFDATRSLVEYTPADIWNKQCDSLKTDLVDCGTQIADLLAEIEDIQLKIDGIDEAQIQLIRSEMDSLQSQIDNTNRALAGSDIRLSNLTATIDSLNKQIAQRLRGEIIAKDKQVAESVAKIITKVLDRAYNTIQDEQVTQLSKRMDALFSQMIRNVTDKDLEYVSDKLGVRMIAKVGIQPIDERSDGYEFFADRRPDSYEIFAHNERGRNMKHSTINGASRRVLALSFVLALCDESKTFAPLIADSLLNFMTGAVRRNTLLITTQISSQPILLLTTGDLALQPEVDVIDKYAGATYTLTGQWDAIDASNDGGDVLRWNDRRLVSLLCSCGPRNYCDICERIGWAKLPGWQKRENER